MSNNYKEQESKQLNQDYKEVYKQIQQKHLKEFVNSMGDRLAKLKEDISDIHVDIKF